MKLTEICISRPVLSTVLSAALVVLGAVSFGKLQIRQYPKIDYPIVSVTTMLEGASPDIMETQVTKIIENALSGIEGVEKMTSRSQTGQSSISVTFKPSRDIEGAANDVRDKVARVVPKLPQDVEKPLIRKADADAVAMMTLVFWSETQDLKDVADYVDKNVESQVQVVGGVASVDKYGGGDFEMHVRLDPVRMAAYNLTAEDIVSSLKQQSFEKPVGTLVTEERKVLVTTKAQLRTEEEFRNVIVGEKDGYLVRIKDVSKEVKFDAIEKQVRVRFNGREAVGLAIIAQSVANPLDISKGIRDILPNLRQNLPEGMKVEIAKDDSVFIERSIQEVYKTIGEAAFLVILVILIFLRTFRAAIIPIVTIPLSLIGVFAMMSAFGFTINIMTLLAFVMAIGLVVDDAIVMLENIYRHIEDGMKPMEAAFKGAKEISFAVIAMTITLAAVYAPIALAGGDTGKNFTEFALTLAGAVVLSGFIALTLSPMMCGRFLKAHHVVDPKIIAQEKPVYKFLHQADMWIDAYLNRLDQVYAKSLRKALTHKYKILSKRTNGHGVMGRSVVIAIALIVAGLGGVFTYNMKQDTSTPEDQGFVKAKGFPPQGASLNYVNRYMEEAEQVMQKIPEFDKQLSTVQAEGEPIIETFLVPWEKRERSSVDIATSVTPAIKEDITGMHFNVWGRGRSLASSSGGGRPIQIIVQSTKSYEELIEVFRDFIKELREIPGIDHGSIEDTITSDEQQLVININRDVAASLSVDPLQIGEMLSYLIKGRPAVYFKEESNRYPVTVELADEFRKNPDDISSLYTRGRRTKQSREEVMIPLSEIVDVEKQLVPTEIHHYDGLRSVTMFGDLSGKAGLGETLEQIKTLAQKRLPEGSKISFAGDSKKFFEESANIILIFILALVSIFLVLSAQYESFLDPLIIMMSVPLSLVGGILTLALAGGEFSMKDGLPTFSAGTLTVFAKIGLVTLVGLITKHGILIVDFANKMVQEDGKDRFNAVIDASMQRLRPILMTTMAMVLGAVPLALASGPGSELRQQIGWVVVGGMSFGTLFTLFVVPAFYTLICQENLRKLLRR